MVHDVNSLSAAGALSDCDGSGRDKDASLPAGFQCETLPASTEIVFQLLAIGERLRQIVAGVAASFDFTPQQALLIDRLVVPRTMGQIAEALSCDKSNVTGLISRLEGRGLVTRTADDHDRRIKWLTLTDAGRTVRRQVRDAIVAHEELLLADTSPRERELFLEYLRQASARIAAPADGGTCPAAASLETAGCPTAGVGPEDMAGDRGGHREADPDRLVAR